MTERRYGDIYKGVAQRREVQDRYEKLKAYRDQRTAYVVATRGVMPVEVAFGWIGLAHPTNQDRAWLNPAVGLEVAEAYNHLVTAVLDHSDAKKWPWILTLEEDNIPPQRGLLDLFAAVYTCVDCGAEIEDKGWKCPNGHRGLDAISGLYWTKGDPPTPMAYGDPKENVPGEPIKFRPRSIREAFDAGSVIEVNGIAMGFALWRMDLFRRLGAPWFETHTGPNGGGTQDLNFCRRAKEEDGARFAVACNVLVVHMDPATGRRW